MGIEEALPRNATKGCRLMGIGRSIFYDTPGAGANDATVVAEIAAAMDASTATKAIEATTIIRALVEVISVKTRPAEAG
jgi:hypothetical protein